MREGLWGCKRGTNEGRGAEGMASRRGGKRRTWRRAWRSSTRMFWNRSLRTKRMAARGGAERERQGIRTRVSEQNHPPVASESPRAPSFPLPTPPPPAGEGRLAVEEVRLSGAIGPDCGFPGEIAGEGGREGVSGAHTEESRHSLRPPPLRHDKVRRGRGKPFHLGRLTDGVDLGTERLGCYLLLVRLEALDDNLGRA